jgi:5-methylcytosine-specific restriction endonuclease McrA
MSSVAELIDNIAAEERERAARSERLRAQKAKNYYGTPEWRRVRYLFLRQQKRPLTCSLCNRSDGVICVDHIKSVRRYPELRSRLDNLQLLCTQCNLGKGSDFDDDWR